MRRAASFLCRGHVPDTITAREDRPDMTRTTRPLPAIDVFLYRFLRGLAIFGVLIAGSLTLGAAGYHRFENLPWLDAYLNASMILTGMGPLENPQSHDGKLF